MSEQNSGSPLKDEMIHEDSFMSLVQASNLHYQGSFRLPASARAAFGYATACPMAFNPHSGGLSVSPPSLFLARGADAQGVRAGAAVDLAIPTSFAGIPEAPDLEGVHDPVEGHLTGVSPDGQIGNGILVGGLLVQNRRLIGTAYIYYDANGTQRVSHFTRSLNLAPGAFEGWYRVDGIGAGMVSGYLCDIPPLWRSRLGGTMLTGQSGIPIVSRTSWGPCAVAITPPPQFSPRTTPIPSVPLVYYTAEHPTLGGYETAEVGSASQVGTCIPLGFDSLLFIGRVGTGRWCYGSGTADRSLDGLPDGAGGHYCYDPAQLDKGGHAWPYEYHVWAYKLADLADVRTGRKQPWEITPYAQWPILSDWTAPTWTPLLGGVAFDATRNRMYVTQCMVDFTEEFNPVPLIHVIDVR